jgi:hypothetical protein
VGNVMSKQALWQGPSLCVWMVPWWALMMALVMVRPDPAVVRVRPVSVR